MLRIIALGLMAYASACSQQNLERKDKPKTIKAESKAAAADQQASFQSRLDQAKKQLDTQALVDATLAFRLVTLGTSETLCSGRIKGKVMIGSLVNSNKGLDLTQLLQVDQKQIDCAGFAIDPNAILGIFSAPAPVASTSPTPEPGFLKDIEVHDSYIAVKKMGSSTFAPARPLLPSILAAEPAVLAALDLNLNATLSEAGSTYPGTFGLKMESFAKPFPATLQGIVWPDSMTFSLISSGFAGASILPNGLFQKIQISLSRDPIMLAGLQVETSIFNLTGNYLTKADQQSLLAALAGTILDTAFVQGVTSDVRLTVEVVDFVEAKR